MNDAPRKLAARCLPWLLAGSLLGGCASTMHESKPAIDLQAHRGGRALAPENTLSAFLNAIALGVNTLELDIGLTADDVVVISHDTALNPDHTRDTQGQFLTSKGPRLAHADADAIAVLRRGSDQSRDQLRQVLPRKQLPRNGEHIPTLAALFERVRKLGADQVRFNIETKVDPTRPDETAPPDQMVRALLAEIDKAGMAQRVTIQSFDWRSLALVGERKAPQMPRAYLYERGHTEGQPLDRGPATRGFRLGTSSGEGGGGRQQGPGNLVACIQGPHARARERGACARSSGAAVDGERARRHGPADGFRGRGRDHHRRSGHPPRCDERTRHATARPKSLNAARYTWRATRVRGISVGCRSARACRVSMM